MDRIGVVLCIALAGVGLGAYGALASQRLMLANKRLEAEMEALRRAAPQQEAVEASDWKFEFKDYHKIVWETGQHEEQINNIYSLLHPLREGTSAALLNAREKGFSLANTPFGAFPIRIDGVKPCPAGYAVVFMLGNPLSGAVSGVTMEINYGQEFTEGLISQDPAEWSRRYKDTRKISGSVAGDLASGRWTRVRVVLPRASDDDLGRIEVVLKIGKMALSAANAADLKKTPIEPADLSSAERLPPDVQKMINDSVEKAAAAGSLATKCSDLADKIEKEQAVKATPSVSPALQAEFNEIKSSMQGRAPNRYLDAADAAEQELATNEAGGRARYEELKARHAASVGDAASITPTPATTEDPVAAPAQSARNPQHGRSEEQERRYQELKRKYAVAAPAQTAPTAEERAARLKALDAQESQLRAPAGK